jgi:hypothetical protein
LEREYRIVKWALLLAASAGLLVIVGCDSGGQVYHLSGAITYQGKPVPGGTIVFEPDATKENEGAPGYAKIKDGRYDTRAADGKGTVGGPHLVRILGLDGIPRGELLNGMPVFPEYSTTADLPTADSTKDFVVPRGGGSPTAQ